MGDHSFHGFPALGRPLLDWTHQLLAWVHHPDLAPRRWISHLSARLSPDCLDLAPPIQGARANRRMCGILQLQAPCQLGPSSLAGIAEVSCPGSGTCSMPAYEFGP